MLTQKRHIGASACLTASWLPFVLPLLSACLASPSLTIGWSVDDFFHRLAYTTEAETFRELTGMPPARGPMRMYTFFSGDPQNNKDIIEKGFIPWWSNPELKIRFFRPLAAWTHVWDYAVWPNQAWLMHLHSLGWLMVLIAAAALFFRNYLGYGWPAGLAALFFAIDDTHAIPVSLLANRHGLMACAATLLVLIAYKRWRERKGRRWGAAAVAGYGLALLISEAAVAGLAFLLAYELYLTDSRWWERGRALLPFILATLIWRIVYSRMGYGTFGNEFYADPGAEPMQFLYAVLVRGPVLLLAALGGPPAELYMFFSPWAIGIYAGICLWVLLLLLGVFSPLIFRDRVMAFFTAGAILSVIPFCAVMPSNRNLTFVSVAVMGLLARALWGLRRADARQYPLKVIKHTAWLALGLMLLIQSFCAPILMAAQTQVVRVVHSWLEAYMRLPLNQWAGNTVIFVNPPGSFMSTFARLYLYDELGEIPSHVRLLSAGMDAIELERIDARTLAVRPERGYFRLPGPAEPSGALHEHINFQNQFIHFETLYRPLDYHLPKGWRIALDDLAIEITGIAPNGRPSEARFEFERPLEDEHYKWFMWGADYKAKAFNPPPVGETVRIVAGRN